VWWYGTDRVLGTIGYVPVEEYLFFVLQPLLTGAWTYLLLMPAAGAPRRARTRRRRWLGSPRSTLGVAVYALLTPAGAAGTDVRAGDCTSGSSWPGRRRCCGAVVVHGGNWARPRPCSPSRGRADALSVDRRPHRDRRWHLDISPRYTTGIHLAGLPLEEAVFFLVTNLLVVQGVLLFLQPALAAPRRACARRMT
jgi:lycopene beta-cyclase